MKLKDKLLELSKTYEEMRKEALRIVEAIKPKVKNITDAQIVQSIIEKRDFYWKHDLQTVQKLAEEYKIKISKLIKLVGRYLEIEQVLLKNKIKFENLDLKEVTFGPKTLVSASSNKNSEILIYPKNKELDIRVYPEFDKDGNKDFEKFAEGLKKKIQNLIEINI